MLGGKGRLGFETSAEDLVRKIFRTDGVVEEPIRSDIAYSAAALGDGFHGDPADRIIVSTAILRGLPLVTRDRRISAFLHRTKLAPVIAC
jgi:PIN domain nuclease of toxin-antitoxin system